MNNLQLYFSRYQKNVIGSKSTIDTPYGKSKPIRYADWTASGRNYGPIEKRIIEDFMPFVGNTHTETTATGLAMTHAYTSAKKIIKKHVNASTDDVLICCGSGMTGAINKFQRILGLRVHENFKQNFQLNNDDRPVVFITHMEHHSNQTSWLETIAEVVVIAPDSSGLVCLQNFKTKLTEYASKRYKIAAITSCSNVTGIITSYYEIAELMHKNNGFCFVDFACSAPYVSIDMHPTKKLQQLDAIYFSPHKFLGGPGSPGILVFNKHLYRNNVPDNPGGGTVNFTNPWGEHAYSEDIEVREDGGTPAFLQTIKAALCMKLKEEMGTVNIQRREKELLQRAWNKLDTIPNLHILAKEHKSRLGIISFYIDELHYNVGVKMLNDKFGIQTRGGCSCAGTYGHYLLNISEETSNQISEKIAQKDYSTRPGWIRMSVHPTMSNEEMDEILEGIASLAKNFKKWTADYTINCTTGSVQHTDEIGKTDALATRMDKLLEREFD